LRAVMLRPKKETSLSEVGYAVSIAARRSSVRESPTWILMWLEMSSSVVADWLEIKFGVPSLLAARSCC
jgi:hypothetical protein